MHRVEDIHIRTVDYKNLFRVDRVMVLMTALLAFIGIVTLYSADYSSGFEQTLAWRQVRNIAVALFFAAAVVVCDYRFLIAAAPLFYGVVLALLVFVAFQGDEHKGAQSWIGFGYANLQPAEMSKIAVIYMFAWYSFHMRDRVRRFHWYLFAFAIPAVPGLLLLKQPDFGTALTLGPLTLVMLFIMGCKRLHLLATLALGTAAALVIIAHAQDRLDPPFGMPGLKPHQKTRIVAFLDPNADPLGSGWHQLQTRIAIGSGGMWGKGYMEGVQTHLNWVPESHTDSIFALYAEEQGLVGSIVLLGLYAAFLLRGAQLARMAADLPAALLAVGSVTILATHIFINIGIAIGLMPVTGLPLPFLSYGGSFYICVLVCIATALNVAIKQKKGFFTEREPVIRGVARV